MILIQGDSYRPSDVPGIYLVTKGIPFDVMISSNHNCSHLIVDGVNRDCNSSICAWNSMRIVAVYEDNTREEIGIVVCEHLLEMDEVIELSPGFYVIQDWDNSDLEDEIEENELIMT